MSLAQGNITPTRVRIEPGSPDPESDALTTRPVRPPPLQPELFRVRAHLGLMNTFKRGIDYELTGVE